MIYPTILCGGSGTRLWPLSRKSYPKQFAPLLGDLSLFQSTAMRAQGGEYAPPIIVTNSDFRFIATQQLAEIGTSPSAVLIEPDGRNTAPAILSATLFAAQTQPDAMMLVMPSDHLIPDTAAFRRAVARGIAAAQSGQIVTFGVAPTHPETGYGYLKLGQTSNGTQDVHPLAGFVEKPPLAAAQDMLASGGYLWNAGIFLFRADVILAAFAQLAPQVLAPVQRAFAAARSDLGFLRMDPAAWAVVPDISIDYALMEQCTSLSAVTFDGHWSDLGGWESVWADGEADAQGVVQSGAVLAIDCADSLLRADHAGVELVGIGLNNIIAIAMSDAVLVADKSRAQDVKLAVGALRNKGVRQADAFPKDHRPWGWFESLVIGDGFQVKRIHVEPGASLSLQSHNHRAEHWVVVMGTAEVTIGDTVQHVGENQSVYIPLGVKHRLRNTTERAVVVIEVQTGAYLGDDDIIRFDDAYARKSSD